MDGKWENVCEKKAVCIGMGRVRSVGGSGEWQRVRYEINCGDVGKTGKSRNDEEQEFEMLLVWRERVEE